MKTKIGTVMDKELVKQLKERAVREDRSISDILQDALHGYLKAGPKRGELRIAAVERFCSRPFHLSGLEIQKILAEEYFEQ